jgi:hypothetical protein
MVAHCTVVETISTTGVYPRLRFLVARGAEGKMGKYWISIVDP